MSTNQRSKPHFRHLFDQFRARYEKLGLHKLHLFYALAIYAFLGGLIFQLLEFDYGSKRFEG